MRATDLHKHNPSLVRSLEDQVATLESELNALQSSPSHTPQLFASKIARATLSIGILPTSSRLFHESDISFSLFLHPSCPPLPVARAEKQKAAPLGANGSRIIESIPRRTRSDIQSSSSSTNLKAIPRVALDHMIHNYTSIHLPLSPIIEATWLHTILNKILTENEDDTNRVLTSGIPASSSLIHFDYFVVFIVLAISSLTLTWKSEPQAVLASDGFWASALQHLEKMVEVKKIQTLQVSLLLAHYAHMNPEKVDNWLCISNAIRTVLDLASHRAPPKNMDREQARLRSRLFWVAYGMERSLCGTLRLPLSIPEEDITVQLDNEEDILDAIINSNSPTSNTPRKESSANHLYHYRKLETEVHRVLHLQETVPFLQTHEISAWLEDVNTRLTAWHQKAQTYAIHNMLEFRDVQHSCLLAKLHRPCPTIRTRTHSSRLICLNACQTLVEDYLRQVSHKRLFYLWLGVHVLFEAAVIMLDACWSSKDAGGECKELWDKARFVVAVTLPECITLLERVGDRWGEAILCAGHLKPVLQDVAQSFNARTMGGVSCSDDKEEATTQTLQSLLFPDGPLAWNARAGVDSSAPFFEGLPELGDFHWDADWDLADMFQDVA